MRDRRTNGGERKAPPIPIICNRPAMLTQSVGLLFSSPRFSHYEWTKEYNREELLWE